MSRTVAIILILVAFGVGAAVGILGFLWATGGSVEESEDIANVAPTLSLDGPTPTPNASNLLSTQVADLNGKVDGLATQVAQNATDLTVQLDTLAEAIANVEVAAPTEVTAQPTATLAPTIEATPEATEEAANTEEEQVAGEPRRGLFRISQDDSEARYKIDEILFGNPTTVVGTTSRVAGDVIVNFDDPAASQIGQIAINARTLRTDNDFRDQAVRSRILQSAEDAFEFITFAPTGLTGLTDQPVQVGDTLEFQIEGDLTVRGETRPVTFDITVNVTGEDQIEGLATTTILYPDFNISIQAPPTVTGIEDEVILEIDFVAMLVDEQG